MTDSYNWTASKGPADQYNIWHPSHHSKGPYVDEYPHYYQVSRSNKANYRHQSLPGAAANHNIAYNYNMTTEGDFSVSNFNAPTGGQCWSKSMMYMLAKWKTPPPRILLRSKYLPEADVTVAWTFMMELEVTLEIRPNVLGYVPLNINSNYSGWCGDNMFGMRSAPNTLKGSTADNNYDMPPIVKAGAPGWQGNAVLRKTCGLPHHGSGGGADYVIPFHKWPEYHTTDVAGGRPPGEQFELYRRDSDGNPENSYISGIRRVRLVS